MSDLNNLFNAVIMPNHQFQQFGSNSFSYKQNVQKSTRALFGSEMKGD